MYKNYSDQLEYQRKWRKSNPRKVAEIKSRYYSKKPEKFLIQKSRSTARKKNLEHTITDQDITIPEVCPVFKTPFEKCTMYAMSIDRIDNEKGYIPGNIQVISRLANTMKNSASQKELEEFAKWVLKLD